MELRQLKYFVKVAEILNFSEAAKVLCITQSTLSQQIRQLEQELNAQLFQRDSHTVCITEEGEALLPYAIKTINAADTCVQRINDLKEMLSGSLNIGVTYSFSPILTETLLDFMKQYPRVKLNIYYKPMIELITMLQRKEVDFILAFKPSRHFDDIESHSLFDNHLAVIVNDNHPLAQKESVTFSDLEKYDIALPAKGLQARNAFDAIHDKYFSKLNVRIELNEVNILLKLIKQSNLVTILAEATIHNEAGVKAVPIDFPGNEMNGCVHTLKNTYRKHSVLEFIKMLRQSNAVKERICEWL